ncbi:permease prefix domain 1-containing protein [Vallitalea okinawensis]|uniref:permease prefix domain 1-containing protein n=1 Tax=Vallitalea okinawensis TaxID=2078660 RepID=UPI000CFCDB00|nr:permease prefix domain 1-containing protein [Vallitalea okinawensis]
MKRIESYVHKLFKEIPDSETKKSIVEEIIQNLEEKVMDMMDEGKDEEDAINKALIDFGDIDDIKKELIDQYSTKNSPTKSSMRLMFSICAAGLIISLLIFMNFYYTPNVIWFVYPLFVIIWWPFIMFYRWYEQRHNHMK